MAEARNIIERVGTTKDEYHPFYYITTSNRMPTCFSVFPHSDRAEEAKYEDI